MRFDGVTRPAGQPGHWNRAREWAIVQAMGSNGRESDVLAGLGQRSIVLVGMMGAGKTSIGRRLAARLHIPFVDADHEIEEAAAMSIPDIFNKHGEPYFRAGEARVIARLLSSGPQVLATGGGAFMAEDTRQRVRERGLSVWLKADFDVLLRRVKRRSTADRPMLKADPEASIRSLMEARYPVYAEADITVLSRDVAHDVIVDEIVAGLKEKLSREQRVDT